MSDNTAQLVADLTACRSEVDSLEAQLATQTARAAAAEAAQRATQAELAAAEAALLAAQSGLAPLEAEIAAAEAEAARWYAHAEALSADLTASNAALAEAEAALAPAEAAAAHWQTIAEAWAAKYDLLYGEVEPGIIACPGYVSSDGRHHANLDAARRHNYATTAEAQAQAARLGQPLTQGDVDELAALGATIAAPVVDEA
jgi:hypothetical protein